LDAIFRSRWWHVEGKPAMEEPGLIAEYARRLASALDFDPSLSRRVRKEVEDHLWQAVSANPASERRDAERRAIANFGDPDIIAGQFAVASLAKLARSVGVAAMLAIAVVFVAMKARVAWYGVMDCPSVEPIGRLGEIVISVDRLAFWLAVVVGGAGWIYIDSLRVPPTFTSEYRVQLRRFSLLCLATTGALIASVVSDAVVTSLRLLATGWSVQFLVPALSMAIEIACAGVLISYLRDMARRTASTRRAALQ
jgi:hypothetical protein